MIISKKNILIYVEDASLSVKGGTERASYLLFNQLSKIGYNVLLISLKNEDVSISNKSIIILPSKNSLLTSSNKNFVEKICKKQSIDVIINMSANSEASDFFNNRHLNVKSKIISVINFSIMEGLDYYPELIKFDFSNFKSTTKSIIRFLAAPISKYLALYKKRGKLLSIVKHSWKVVVLSEKYKEDLQRLLNTKQYNNVVSIPVLATFENKVVKTSKKRDIVLYVGRLNYESKRVDRLLKIWRLVEQSNISWELHIVGDGNERDNLRKLSQDLGLKKVQFHGHTSPVSHYEKAKILCLTSTHEGMPMVIIEAISHGCYPILFNSFAAANEMIPSDKQGILIKPFDLKEFANKLLNKMNQPYNPPDKQILNNHYPDAVIPMWVKCIENHS